MKLLLSFFLLFPLLVNGQDYFRCDHKKIAKIIRSNTGIIKASKSKYTVAGEVQLEIWNIKYNCDSAVFDCKRKELTIYGNIEEIPVPKVYVFHCDSRIFLLSKGLITVPYPAY